MRKVVLYTKDNCQPCRATKRRLKAWGVDFEEVSITEDIAVQLRSEGFLQSPVVKVYDAELDIVEESWSGFNVTKLEEYFKPYKPGVVIGQSDGGVEQIVSRGIVHEIKIKQFDGLITRTLNIEKDTDNNE